MNKFNPPRFTFVDLFAGIGGFATALHDLGGTCVQAVEFDPRAAAIYKLNHGIDALGDITNLANDDVVSIGRHDVLTAGFPCQPFSKSGAQRGMEETRGTLFWNILKVLQARRPAVIILENVRNLAGPRHRHEWEVIIRELRKVGYHVSSRPAVASPHNLPAEKGGSPQVRERVFITGTYWPSHSHLDPDPAVTNIWSRDSEWDLATDLPLSPPSEVVTDTLTADEVLWIDAWEDFRKIVLKQVRAEHKAKRIDGAKLPGFPIWVDAWTHESQLQIPEGTPSWKENFLRKNSALYTKNQDQLDRWQQRWKVQSFPVSRRKFEWQAQQESSLWNCAIQLRPSGLRAKRMTHLPALVAMTQTPILGPLRRRLTVREAARLQGLPDHFSFGDQPDTASFKQLGNGVNVGVVQYVFQAHVARDIDRIREIAPQLLTAHQQSQPARQELAAIEAVAA